MSLSSIDQENTLSRSGVMILIRKTAMAIRQKCIPTRSPSQSLANHCVIILRRMDTLLGTGWPRSLALGDRGWRLTFHCRRIHNQSIFVVRKGERGWLLLEWMNY